MVGLATRRKKQAGMDYWPGFVDAMATLLLVIIFVLSIFMIAQFFLAQEISGRDSALNKLNTQIAELTELLALEKSTKANLEATLAALTDDLAASESENARLSGLLSLSDKDSRTAEGTITSLSSQLSDEKQLRADALAQVELLNQQIAALRRQLASIQEALDAAEQSDRESKAQIVDLGKRLNAALARKVQQLSKFRSEFFGRLREILSNRSDIRIVGDRFVFQSEVFFGKGEAAISVEGRTELDKLASAMLQLVAEIPGDLNWVLRVDGHTDVDPINTFQFPSNWELSTARAISVVRYLVSRGVPPHRLVAAGFGEFQPIDAAGGEDANRKNRRIELKLTER
jgi:chemotaxis protein MotB